MKDYSWRPGGSRTRAHTAVAATATIGFMGKRRAVYCHTAAGSSDNSR